MTNIPDATQQLDQQADIFAFGFSKSLLRDLPQLSNSVVYNAVEGEVNPINLQYGSTVGGWTLGNTTLKSGFITFDASLPCMKMSDGSNVRVYLGPK